MFIVKYLQNGERFELETSTHFFNNISKNEMVPTILRNGQSQKSSINLNVLGLLQLVPSSATNRKFRFVDLTERFSLIPFGPSYVFLDVSIFLCCCFWVYCFLKWG